MREQRTKGQVKKNQTNKKQQQQKQKLCITFDTV